MMVPAPSLRWGFLIVLALTAVMLVSIPVAFAASNAPRPVIEIANPGECIAPAAQMRANHHTMISHARDRTSREGFRGEPASLMACVNCHASKTTGSVLGKEGFCQSCHEYTAVKMNCWQCHQPIADWKQTGSAGGKP